MSIPRLGMGSIEYGSIPEAIAEQIEIKLLEAGAWNIDIYPDEITFYMWVEKGYKDLEDIEAYMLSKGLEFSIETSDFEALGSGYYFDSTDDEE